MANPLLSTEALPLFHEITAAHVSPALDVLLREAELALDRAGGPDVPAQYEALSAVLATAVERLSRAWGVSPGRRLGRGCDQGWARR